jgi:CheY-like chemotaxis protein
MARILLIDDDAALRSLLSLTLTHFGHTVIEARHGKEGLRLFPHARADLVLTDLMMPEMEGIELMMELRKKQPPVKVIVMSGGGRYGAAEYLRMVTMMGAAKVLTKPFSQETLLAAIQEVLAAGHRPGGGGESSPPPPP